MTDPQFWWFLARATGLVAWALLSTTVVWGSLLHSGLLGRWISRAWIAAVHRFLGMLSVLFISLHVTGLLLDSYVQLSLRDLLVPLASSWRPVPVAFGVVAGYLILAVLGTSLLTTRLPRRWWRRVHLTSYLLFWSATMHLITAGTDAGNGAARAVVAGTVIAVLLLSLLRISASARSAHAARSTRSAPSGPAVRAAPAAPAFHPLEVAEVRRETPDAVSVRFAIPPDLAPEFRFRPGQYVVLRARIDDAVVSRPYSICSGVSDSELRIAVRELPGGRMSTWVNTVLRPGDVVDVAAPAGSFATDLDMLVARHVLGVAAGSGITPVISVLSSVLAVEPASRCSLVYGNRTAASTLFAARLAELECRYPDRLRVVHLRSREPAHPPLLPGRIDREALRTLARPGGRSDVDEAYVCGPGAMTTEVRKVLIDDLGLPPSHVHTEVFSSARTMPSTAEPGPGTVRLRHRGAEHTVPVGAGESVLDAGLRAGLDLPYGCRVGACGTCSAAIRPRAADDETVTQGLSGPRSVILTCQFGPAGDLTVDFDAVADSDSRPRRAAVGQPGG